MNVAALIPLVSPDFCAVGGSGQLRVIVGALLTYGLIVAVLIVVTCGATWTIASSSGSWQAAGKAKTGLFVDLERRRPHWSRTRLGQRNSSATRPRRSPSGTTSTAGSWCRTTAPRPSGLLLGLSPPTIPQSGPEGPQALRTAPCSPLRTTRRPTGRSSRPEGSPRSAAGQSQSQSAPKVRPKPGFSRSAPTPRFASPQVRATFCQQSDAFDVVRHREDVHDAERSAILCGRLRS